MMILVFIVAHVIRGGSDKWWNFDAAMLIGGVGGAYASCFLSKP